MRTPNGEGIFKAYGEASFFSRSYFSLEKK